MLTPNLKSVKLGGELSARIEMAARRLLKEETIKARENWTCTPYSTDYLLADLVMSRTEGSPCGHWAGDEAGRYINALSAIFPYAGNLYPQDLREGIKQKLEKVVAGVLSLQRPEGYFGAERQEGRIYRDHTSGHNWMLKGLTEYYNLAHDDNVLSAAKKLANYYVKTHPLWTTPEAMVDIESPDKAAYVYSNYTHCIDGLVNIYRASREEKYLELAKQVAKLVKPFEHAIHSHHFFSTLRGMVNLYLETADTSLLDRLEEEWEKIHAKGLLPTGGAPEHYIAGWTSDEGCSEADWMMINLYMWSITRKFRYIEMAEKTLLNHFFWNQSANGGFSCNYGGGDFRNGKMGNHTPGKRNEAYWCCSMHGTYGLSEIAKYVVTFDNRSVWINLFNDIKGALRMMDSEVRFNLRTLYPLKGQLHLEIESENPFDLKIRAPSWLQSLPEGIPLGQSLNLSAPTSVGARPRPDINLGGTSLNLTVNGASVQPDIKDGYIVIPKKGRRLKVELNFPMQVRTEAPAISSFSYNKSDFVPASVTGKNLIFYGPSILRPVDKLEEGEIVIIPDNPDFRIEKGLLRIKFFAVKSPEDAADKEKWQARIFEPISQETFSPMDITEYLFRVEGLKS